MFTNNPNNIPVHYNSNMIVYGSDHCVTEYNGITVKSAIKRTKYNSRDKLWMVVR